MSGAAFQFELTPEELPPRTDLSKLPFAVLLANARMLGSTGILELRGEKRVFISRGNPVHIESDLAQETSELYLLRTGIVDASEMEPARELARSRGGKIGEALLGLGLLEANELFEHTRNRARDSLISCFDWEYGAACWEPRERFGPDVLPIPLDTVKVFFDGILRFYDRRRLDRELPVDDGSRVYPVESPRIAVSAASVGTIEARILKLAAGKPSLASAALALGVMPDDLRRRLYALYCLGLVGFEVDSPMFETTPVPRPPPSVSTHVPRAGTGSGGTGPWPVIGTAPGSPPPPPRESPPSPARGSQLPPAPSRGSQLPPAPSRGSQLPPAPSRESQPPQRPAPAARVLTPPVRPAVRAAPAPANPTAARGPKTIAKSGKPTKPVYAYLEDAEIARASKDFEGSLLALEYALEMEPQNASLWGEKAFTLMLLDPRLHGKEAHNLAREARREDPSQPLPYVVLGMLMEQVRETERAIQMYRVALQKDPICEPAQTRLEALEDKRR